MFLFYIWETEDAEEVWHRPQGIFQLSWDPGQQFNSGHLSASFNKRFVLHTVRVMCCDFVLYGYCYSLSLHNTQSYKIDIK